MRKIEQRSVKTGRYAEIDTLPAEMMLRDHERDAVEKHAIALRSSLLDVNEPETLTIVTKMMLALPSQKTNDAGAEASAEAFMMALDDVPTWAVRAALRGWYRGSYNGERFLAGRRFNFHWRPAPADLRDLALHERWQMAQRLEELNRLLGAEALIEFSEEERRAMQERIAALKIGKAA